MGNTPPRKLPPEIQRLNERDQQLYRKAIASGSIKVDNIRVMVIGHQGVGKTSLVKRLLGEEVRANETKSTDGIDFHHLQINHDTGEWSETDLDRAELNRYSMIEVLHDYDRGQSSKPHKGADSQKESGSDIVQTSEDKSNVGKIVPVSDKNYMKETKEEGIKSVQTNLEIQQLVRESQAFIPHDILLSPLTIMDFAGQFLYYTTHQTFISWRTIYLLVTDLSRPLGDPVSNDTVLVVSENEPSSVQDHVLYWLNSIDSHVFLPIEPFSDQRQGDVILVGTHLDVIPKGRVEERKKEHFGKIRELLRDRSVRYHLVETEFAVTNVKSDTTIDALRKKIFEVAQKQDYWGTTIPARWMALENALLKLAKKGKKVIPYTEVELLNESLEVKLESKDELDAFLKFEHELGHCIYFSTEALRAHVMLDPQWLIEGLKIWIGSGELIKKHPKLTGQWYNFTKTGQLTEELIELLWSEYPELHQHQKHLLSVMENLNIIAKAPLNDGQSGKDQFYWVPCMVHRSGSTYATTLGKGHNLTMTPAICFVSKTKFIHVGVFHRLLASCLTQWQPAKMGDEYLFFNGLCEFELNKDHVLVLSLNDYVIQASLIRYSTRNYIPDVSLCITTREFLLTAIKEIADLLCPACEFDIYIKCSRSSPLSNEGLHRIKDLQDNYEIRCAEHKNGSHSVRSDDLLEFWEGKGARVPTIVQTAESACATNRFMKIYCLLVDVGSKVLRQLLKDKAAERNLTLDQYMQQKKNDIEILRKRKALSEVQMNIMFPTNGDTDIDKYDIALSSVLLANIFPSLDIKEKHKINDIRDERNKFAHAKSTKMSNSEFQTKWTKVTTTLRDLSKLCQGINFKADIQRLIEEINEYGSEDLKSVFEKYNEDLKREIDATLDKYSESQKQEIEVRLAKYKEDLDKEMEAKLNNYKAEIENLKKNIQDLEKQIRKPEKKFGHKTADLLE